MAVVKRMLSLIGIMVLLFAGVFYSRADAQTIEFADGTRNFGK